jgi:hypothetical protein
MTPQVALRTVELVTDKTTVVGDSQQWHEKTAATLGM